MTEWEKTMKTWYCEVCGKTTTSETPNDDAAPEHISHRGFDIGTCPGEMVIVEETEQDD